MSRNRAKKNYTRIENTRDQKQSIKLRDLLTFSFKDLVENQPIDSPESLALWHDNNLLRPLINRLNDLSKLTRHEAEKQQQIKIYGEIPQKSHFTHPEHVAENVDWGVIKAVGGQKRVVAGYIMENTFYIVFLDSEHKFWPTEKKHT